LTWHDALWRPVLVEEHDAGDVANTRRSVRHAYDAAGRTSFVSYPSSLDVPPLAGVSTRQDALGRTVRIERTSELGPLVSSVDYLDDFRIRATNARGHATVAHLRAYDTPETHWADGIDYPDGLHVDIARNVLGQPTRITQRSADHALSTTDHAVYDPHGRLCKAISAASGATVIARDVMGNVTWTAEGTTLDDTTDCQFADAHGSGRRVDRSWDARGRLATVAYPDGVGNQAWTYTADGLPSRITTYNARAGAVVFNGYAWNARRLLVNEWINRLGYSWHLYTAHDRNGHPTTLTYPNTTAVGLVPDSLGRPTRLGNYVTGVRWHPDGTVARFTYGNGIVHTATRNARGLPERRRDAYGGLPFHDESLDYDVNGNLAATSDGLPDARGDRVLRYDVLDRLAQVDSPLFGTARYDHDPLGRPAGSEIGGTRARTHHFCRDARGLVTNIKTIDCIGGPSVIGLAYDPVGNLVRMNAQEYAYDLGRRLRDVVGIERYEYDGFDRRVRAMSAAGEVLSQYAIDGRLMWQVDAGEGRSKLHLYLGDRLVGVREQPLTGGAATIRYLHTDVSGTPVAETGPDRALLRRHEYEPFGLRLDAPETAGVGFLGHVMDARTGLRYAPGAYFHPLLLGGLAACGWNHHADTWDASTETSRLLLAAPRARC
jgi:YD repeat-containing protein